MFTGIFREQLARIAAKFPRAAAADSDFKRFGAGAHKYVLHPPLDQQQLEAWEAHYGVRIPESYAAFLTQLGNGGAGPYYGLEGLLREAQVESRANQPCLITPGMKVHEWQALLNLHDGADDQAYDLAFDKAYRGLLRVGTCGCSYDFMLVVSGSHRGRILYTDSNLDVNRPFFYAHEESFLDWYERWLDEVIQGYDTTQFGQQLGGDDTALRGVFRNACTVEEQVRALKGMYKLPIVTGETVDFLERITRDIKARCLDMRWTF